MGVLEHALARVERDEQARLVDEVQRPTLKSCPRPPMPAMCQEKSSRNWNFFCSVVCGVLGLWPTDTPFGNSLVRVRAGGADVVPEVRVLEDELVQLRCRRAPSCDSG